MKTYKVTKDGKTVKSGMTARDAKRLAIRILGERTKESPTSNAAPGHYGCGAMGM
jgi:hypothetical protein